MLGWKLSDKGFASRGLDNLGQDNKPLDELASGAANVAHHISLSSFVIGYSGSNDIRKHKTHLLKKLLSNGIDVVDLDETTAPLIHLAVNEGMASGSLYLRAICPERSWRLISLSMVNLLQDAMAKLTNTKP